MKSMFIFLEYVCSCGSISYIWFNSNIHVHVYYNCFLAELFFLDFRIGTETRLIYQLKMECYC